MAQAKHLVKDRVYLVSYTYDDIEYNKTTEFSEYCKDFHGVIEYLQKIDAENQIVDNEFYKCRSNIRIKIRNVSIRHSMYIRLFNP